METKNTINQYLIFYAVWFDRIKAENQKKLDSRKLEVLREFPYTVFIKQEFLQYFSTNIHIHNTVYILRECSLLQQVQVHNIRNP